VAAFLVTFSAPVTYLPGHSKSRPITELVVNTAEAEDARMHAIRVTIGEARILSVTEITDAAA
jgi:hypothetical protein